jgi:hypothetical protein
MMRAVPELFYRPPRNAIAIFTGRNLLWHISAIVLTIAIVITGGWSDSALSLLDPADGHT